MTVVPIDIPSAQNLYSEGVADYGWPVLYDRYHFLSYDWIDRGVQLVEQLEGDRKIAFVCKFSEIIYDTAHLLRNAIDFDCFQKLNIQTLYDRDASPTFDWLVKGGHSDDARVIHRTGVLEPTLSFRNRVVRELKTLRYRFERRHQNSANIFHLNTLTSEYTEFYNTDCINFLVEFWIGRARYKEDQDYPELYDFLLKGIPDFNGLEITIRQGVKVGVAQIVNYHMTRALADLSFLKRSKLKRFLGAGLISGTPKYQGRLLSWYSLEQGYPVIRCAHGGERVFYKDYAWPLSELVYCSQYIAHSQVEAQCFQSRIEQTGYAVLPDMKDIQFLSQGSKKHQSIYESRADCVSDDKTLIYVSNVYMGDLAPNLPAFKVPDSFYYHWQIRLLRFLKQEGWIIRLKAHPKGAYNQTLVLKDYVDEVITGHLDANALKANVMLFDFAGTAFFDSLASGHRIALLNLNHRPFDQGELAHLQQRCGVYQCGFNEEGQIALDEDAIRDILDNAPRHTSNTFAERYFY